MGLSQGIQAVFDGICRELGATGDRVRELIQADKAGRIMVLVKPGKVTLEDLKAMEADLLPPRVVGKVLGCDPYKLTIIARQQPQLLQFNYQIIGNKTIFPRLSIIRWLEGLPEEERP